ncbi:MAG TPA: S41 family peptidase [Vicinamibacterales bacterium]|nr:S41 family peptidase [Vicinamibacterales bacterium]
MPQAGAAVAMVFVALSALAGGFIGSQAVSTQDRLEDRYRVYTAALALVEEQFVTTREADRLVYGSIAGMLRTLDPHSTFLEPRQFEQMRERQGGRYFGIGITIALVNGDITVISLFEGSPAYLAGIRRGDVIVGVGEESAKGWQTEDVVVRVKGPRGTTVDIVLRRPGVAEPFRLTVARDEINIVTVRTAFMVQPGTGYVRLQDFSETTDRELGDALARLRREGMERLILDLRDNPGGPLDQAIAVSSRFLKRGEMVVYTDGRIENMDEQFRATATGEYTDIPLIVMVNRNSASASEIVSGALQDHDRGLVVGEATFGKALVQSVYRVSGDAALALTTGRYFTPSGRLIQRPWDGSFDEYLTYSLREQNADRLHDPAELKYTDSGRKVYSGGGIEPDHFVEGPVEGFDPKRFTRLLYARGAFISFAERFTKQGDMRPGARSAATYTVAPGWIVTDAMVDQFGEFVRSQGARFDEAAFDADRDFIKAMIHFEVDNDLFGVEEARRTLSQVDPQVQSALGFFAEARQLLLTSRSK